MVKLELKEILPSRRRSLVTHTNKCGSAINHDSMGIKVSLDLHYMDNIVGGSSNPLPVF